MSKNRQLTGQQLNEKWRVHAEHALYRKDGTWYERLARFPGALFDINGYILFKTEKDYLECRHLHIRKQTTCRKGIASIPGYIPVIDKDVQ